MMKRLPNDCFFSLVEDDIHHGKSVRFRMKGKSQLAGCIVGVISVVLIAKLMGASDEIIYSLAPKMAELHLFLMELISFFIG